MEDYRYDPSGNRTQTLAKTYTIDPDADRVTDDGYFTYTYTGEGNVATKTRRADNPAGDYLTEYTFDHRNRLTRILVKDYVNGVLKVVRKVNYSYDAFDRLVGRNYDPDGWGPAGAQIAKYVYDGEHIALAINNSGQVKNRYLWADQVDLVLADEQVTNPGTIGNVLWPVADDLGTVRELAQHDGVNTTTAVNRRTYDSFGRLTGETAAAVDHVFGYTGAYWDESFGIQNHHHRWYDPALGRWMSEDPIGFASGDTNLYRYVGNSPVNGVDRSGLVGRIECRDTGAAVKGLVGLLQWRSANVERRAQERQDRAIELMLSQPSLARRSTDEDVNRWFNRGEDTGSLSTGMTRMEDAFLEGATGLSRDEASLGLMKSAIPLLTGEAIRHPDQWYLNHPGRWATDALVGAASNPASYVGALGTAGRGLQVMRRLDDISDVGSIVRPRTMSRVYSVGHDATVPENLVSLGQARAAAVRHGIDMRMFELRFESTQHYGFISRIGNKLWRAPNGRVYHTLSELGLASEVQAVNTISHELNHVRAFLRAGDLMNEEAATAAGRAAERFFIKHQ